MENKDKNPQNLTAAILQVMAEVKSIEKKSEIGEGKNKFLAVSDKDVKQVLQPAMWRAGLVIIPIKIEKEIKVERWKALDYRQQETVKQQVLTEVKVTYQLRHISGETLDLEGYGQAVDAQDKGAGKATTYALKYALLYLFLIPTGLIDDADNKQPDETPKLPTQTLNPDQFNRALKAIGSGEYDKATLLQEFSLTEDQKATLETINA